GEGAVGAKERSEDLVPDPHDPGDRVIDVVQGPEVERHAADLPLIGCLAAVGGASRSVPAERCSAGPTVEELPEASPRSRWPTGSCSPEYSLAELREAGSPSKICTSEATATCRWCS